MSKILDTPKTKTNTHNQVLYHTVYSHPPETARIEIVYAVGTEDENGDFVIDRILDPVVVIGDKFTALAAKKPDGNRSRYENDKDEIYSIIEENQNGR